MASASGEMLLGGLLSGWGNDIEQRQEQQRKEALIARQQALQAARQIDAELWKREDMAARARQRQQEAATQAQRTRSLVRTTTEDANGNVYGVTDGGQKIPLGIRKAPSPPRTREIKRGESVVTQQWNAATGTWSDVATAPRTEHSTTTADFLIPLAQKLAAGGTLTPGEQKAVDLLQRTSVLDQLIGRSFSGAGTGGASSTPTPTTPANADQLLQDARDAISRGADRAAVEQRLRNLGVDPSRL